MKTDTDISNNKKINDINHEFTFLNSKLEGRMGNYKQILTSSLLNLNIGPDIKFSIILGLIFIIIESLYVTLLFQKSNLVYSYIHSALFCIVIISFLLTILLDPGIPSNKYHLTRNIYENIYKVNDESEDGSDNKDESLLKICFICNVYSKSSKIRLSHCKICNLCIINYDHHCMWCGKCIGNGNLIVFYIFCISTFGYLAMYLFLIISYIIEK